MASKLLTCSAASTLVSNRASSYPLPIGLGLGSGLPPKPSIRRTPSSRPSLVVKAQQGIEPMSGEKFHQKVALLNTSPYVRTPWNTSEDEHEIRMWFDMPGLAAENLEVETVDDLLVIRGDGGVDAFGNKILSPYDSRVQLPNNSWKEEITAVFKNGVLYITVPKITKFEHKIIHVPVRAIQ
ncbi:hypothetical protein SOVF_128390 [Spinacia oleracea]|uniref:Small heat shock protein, chloroplastic n=1 Tax=Spinacia oleracea TaxID=3562 RepID=A0A9R0HXB9_SPIOL|nr:small heat shock protein, chloroplastic-like [Spinacia oleracea]KNA12183.1 hypothetical protein SOVF_128390 [Spinacia oleracea]